MSAAPTQPPAIPQSVLYRQALAELEAEFPAATASMLTLLCEAAHLTVRIKLLDFAEEDLFDTDPLSGSHFQSKTPTPLLRLYKERDRITARYQAIIRQLTTLSRRAAQSQISDSNSQSEIRNPKSEIQSAQSEITYGHTDPHLSASNRTHPDPSTPPAPSLDPDDDKLDPDATSPCDSPRGRPTDSASLPPH